MGIYKPKGSRFYWFSYTDNWKRYRKNTRATNRKLAESIFRKRVDELPRARHFPHETARVITFAQLIDRYLAEVVPEKTPNTQADEKRYAQVLIGFFGNQLLIQITPNLVSQFKQQRKSHFERKWAKRLENEKKRRTKEKVIELEGLGKDYGKRTINRELNLLSAAFNQAIKVWGWTSFNPVSSVKREKEQMRVEYFSEDTFGKIYDYLPDWIKPIVLFAKNTGLRRNNIVHLKWTQVNLEQRMVILEAQVMKNSENLGVPYKRAGFRDSFKTKVSKDEFIRS